jgi:Flp pilus assembly protein TadG
MMREGRMGHRGGRSRRSETGAALVELAVALPLLAVILVGTIDFGRAFRTAMIVTNASRMGAQFGAQSLAKAADTTGIVAARDAILTANNITPDVSPAPTLECQCATNTDVIGASSACTPTFTCPSGQHVVVQLKVTAVATFSMTSPMPGLPRSVTISRASSMRVLH